MDPVPQIIPIPQAVGPENRYNGTRVPVLRLDPITVTRQLPPSMSNQGSSGGSINQLPSLARPTIEVPTPGLDYPELNVPTQDEFDAASKAPPAGGDSKGKDTGSDSNPARELTGQLPLPTGATQSPPSVIQAGSETSGGSGLTATDASASTAPAATPAPGKAAPASASVTLPFIGTMPLPSRESVALASTTAVTATFVAVMGKAVFEASLEGIKPLLRLLAIRLKKMRNKDLNDEERQLEFAFAMKKKDKRSLGEILNDFKQYMSENFFDDLIG